MKTADPNAARLIDAYAHTFDVTETREKISGCWRTITGAQHFLALRAYLSTARKNNQPIARALTALATRDPWLPAT